MNSENDDIGKPESPPDLTPFNSAHGEFQESLRQIAKDLSQELDEASKARWDAWRTAREVFERLREEEQRRYYRSLDEAAGRERAYEETEKIYAALINALREGAHAEFEGQRSAEENHRKTVDEVRQRAVERVQKANHSYVGAIRRAWSEIQTNSFEYADLYKLGESMASVAADTESAIRACRY